MEKVKKNIGKIFLIYCGAAFFVIYSILLQDISYVAIAIAPMAIGSIIINKANVLARVGFWTLAIFRTRKLSNKIFAKAVALGTNYNNALGPYAFSLLKEFKFQEAKVIYEQMLERPMNIALKKVILGNLSVCLWKLGRYDESIQVYEEIVLDPDYLLQIRAGDYATLGFVCIEAKQYEKGEKYSKDAMELTPEYAAALDNLGQMYYMQGEFEAAEDYFLQALIKKPTLVESNYYLGCIYEKRGEQEHAMEYFEYALLGTISALNTITREMVLEKTNKMLLISK